MTARRLLVVATACLVSYGTVACGGSEVMSVDKARRQAEAVLRADLVTGSTGKETSRLVQSLIAAPGVAATRGDAGEHVWVYTTPDVTSAQIQRLHARLVSQPLVTDVSRLR
jgi:hypothetical protein